MFLYLHICLRVSFTIEIKGDVSYLKNSGDKDQGSQVQEIKTTIIKFAARLETVDLLVRIYYRHVNQICFTICYDI